MSFGIPFPPCVFLWWPRAWSILACPSVAAASWVRALPLLRPSAPTCTTTPQPQRATHHRHQTHSPPALVRPQVGDDAPHELRIVETAVLLLPTVGAAERGSPVTARPLPRAPDVRGPATCLAATPHTHGYPRAALETALAIMPQPLPRSARRPLLDRVAPNRRYPGRDRPGPAVGYAFHSAR